MDLRGFDRFANSLCGTGTRRGLVRLLAALPLGVTLATLRDDAPDAAAKKKGKDSGRGNSQRGHRRNAGHRHQTGKDKGTHKKNTCRDCCRANGSSCTKKSKQCKPSLCQRLSTTSPPPPSGIRVSAPFTIEAVWTNPETDHDTFLFVPNEAGSAVPSPWINYSCHPGRSRCEDNVYPFTCVSQDALGPGDEITTVRTLLAGTYEYWIDLTVDSPADDVTVLLKDSGGTVVRSWSSPPGSSLSSDIGWHVFNIDGGTGAVTSVNETSDTNLPEGAHDPNTYVCPR